MKNVVITSKSNGLYKRLLLMKRSRSDDAFFIEGARYIRSSYAFSGHSPAFLVCDSDCEEEASALAKEVGCGLQLFRGELFREISETVHSQGVLGVYERSAFTGSLPEGNIAMSESGHVLVLDEVQDPGNVGAILRTADAAGFQTVFLVRGSADPYSPKAARASAGSVLHVRTISGSREEILDFLCEQGCDIVVTAIGGRDFRTFTPHARAALILGNEARGVHFDFVKKASVQLGIPMRGGAESLNVAVAAGILIYHIGGLA